MKDLGQIIANITSYRRHSDKAINSLKGILIGINFDNAINQEELSELKLWIDNQGELLQRNPFIEFKAVIENVFSHKIPANEGIQDLAWLCDRYAKNHHYYNLVTTDLQTLHGICHGILSDGEINDEEIVNLNLWLAKNEHLKTYYPYDEIRSLILSILSDSTVSEEQRLILKTYIHHFVKLEENHMEDKLVHDTSSVEISRLYDEDPSISFQDKTFCITGILQKSNRLELSNSILALGGNPTETLTSKTDYLIVGDNGNPAWAFSSYGRKVEKALGMIKNGHKIVLIHEFDFAEIMDELT